jgi:hypothetical protein
MTAEKILETTGRLLSEEFRRLNSANYAIEADYIPTRNDDGLFMVPLRLVYDYNTQSMYEDDLRHYVSNIMSELEKLRYGGVLRIFKPVPLLLSVPASRVLGSPPCVIVLQYDNKKQQDELAFRFDIEAAKE